MHNCTYILQRMMLTSEWHELDASPMAQNSLAERADQSRAEQTKVAQRNGGTGA